MEFPFVQRGISQTPCYLQPITLRKVHPSIKVIFDGEKGVLTLFMYLLLAISHSRGSLSR